MGTRFSTVLRAGKHEEELPLTTPPAAPTGYLAGSGGKAAACRAQTWPRSRRPGGQEGISQCQVISQCLPSAWPLPGAKTSLCPGHLPVPRWHWGHEAAQVCAARTRDRCRLPGLGWDQAVLSSQSSCTPSPCPLLPIAPHPLSTLRNLCGAKGDGRRCRGQQGCPQSPGAALLPEGTAAETALAPLFHSCCQPICCHSSWGPWRSHCLASGCCPGGVGSAVGGVFACSPTR